MTSFVKSTRLGARRLALSAAVALMACCGQAMAWPFGSSGQTTASQTPGNGQAPNKAATTNTMVSKSGAHTNLPQTPQPDAFQKASPEQVQAALRADALTQAAFFANQFDHDPTDAQSGLYLSNALRALGRNDEAAETAHHVLLFAPDNTDALVAAARAHINGNQAFYAVDPLQHLIKLKPNSWQAYSLLGVAYAQIKRPDDAQTAWATALKLSPNNATVLTNIAMSKVSGGDFAGAEPLLRTAAAQKDATLQVRQNLALVLGLEGKMDEAEKLLRMDLPPEQADSNLAWLRLNLAQHGSGASAPPDRSWATVKSGG